MSNYLVIFGAAVRANGTPSGTLMRRIDGAVAAGHRVTNPCYMPTGGKGATGFVEAEVMRDMLIAQGVAPEAIMMELHARDTLESIRLCDVLLRAADDVETVIPCTSRYHILRCATLLRLRGWKVRTMPMPGDAGLLPWRKLLWYYLKEILALPYDMVLLMARNVKA